MVSHEKPGRSGRPEDVAVRRKDQAVYPGGAGTLGQRDLMDGGALGGNVVDLTVLTAAGQIHVEKEGGIQLIVSQEDRSIGQGC